MCILTRWQRVVAQSDLYALTVCLVLVLIYWHSTLAIGTKIVTVVLLEVSKTATLKKTKNWFSRPVMQVKSIAKGAFCNTFNLH